MKKMSVKKLRELLDEVGIHSDHKLFTSLKPAPPMISYHKSDRQQFARWMVSRAGYKTDPEHGHFLNGYNKVFPVTAATTRDGQFIRARDWASEEYGYTIGEWVKTPFGSWAPQDALEIVLRHHLPQLFEERSDDNGSTFHLHFPHIDVHHWYQVTGANVAVFIQATSVDDAKNRMTHMINRITMDCDLELHVTKRDPEVS